MRKILLLLVITILNANFACGDEYITENMSGACNFITTNAYISAVYEPNSHTCNAGYYLPANTDACMPCPNMYRCNGGTFSFNPDVAQGLIYIGGNFDTNINNFCAINIPKYLSAVYEPNEHTCSSGYYLPANVDECRECPSGNACVGGTYSFNETTDQGIQSCASGAFAPTGSAVCYPHILHVGDSNVYLKSTKQTTPSLNLRIGGDVFYANMTTVRTKMNKDSSHYLHVKPADNVHYYVCDDTTCPQ